MTVSDLSLKIAKICTDFFILQGNTDKLVFYLNSDHPGVHGIENGTKMKDLLKWVGLTLTVVID